MLTANDFNSKTSTNLSYIYPFEIASDLITFQKVMVEKKIMDSTASKLWYSKSKKEFRKDFRNFMESKASAQAKKILIETFTDSDWTTVKTRFGIVEK